MEKVTFTKVGMEYHERVTAVYRSIVGTPGCSWNEYYPNADTVRHSIESGSQYCLLDDNGAIIAVCSAGYDTEIDDPLFNWKFELKNPAYFSGMGVAPEYQGKGYGKYMVTKIIEEARRLGHDGAVALVSKANATAHGTYKDFGFSVTGEAAYYGHDYYQYEIIF
jgi:GNAT superfamily N-acetyltransferase